MKDAILVSRLFAKDRRAVSQFYHRFAPQLRKYIGARVRTAEDAEEILQDTLFSFLDGLRDFEQKSTIRTYVFSICHHKIIDYYRRKKIAHLVFSQLPSLELLVSPLLGPEEVLDEKVIQEKIRRVFARLGPMYRQVLILKYLDDVSVEEIAQRLSISFKSAESRLFRARKAFVELFLSL